MNRERILAREVSATQIPSGDRQLLAAGSRVFIHQTLGGSFTVYVEGNLFRIAGEDAGAIGKEPPQRIELPPDATDADVEALAWSQLKTCYDPEIPVNIVDLGLVYDCFIERREDGTRHAKVNLTLTAPGCGMGEVLVQDAKDKLLAIPTIATADIELVFDPPWDREMMSEEARLQMGMM